MVSSKHQPDTENTALWKIKIDPTALTQQFLYR